MALVSDLTERYAERCPVPEMIKTEVAEPQSPYEKPSTTHDAAPPRKRISLRKTFFLVASCLVIPCFLLVVFFIIPDAIQVRKDIRPDYPYPALSDLWIVALSQLAFIPLRLWLPKHVFRKIGDRLLPTLEERKIWTREIREERLQRFGNCAFKLMYFIFSTLAGFYVLWDSPCLPTHMGGTGAIANCFTDYPFVKAVPFLKTYYLIELGYHVHSLLFHLFAEQRNDFLEMLLHHSTAIALCTYSYFTNHAMIGSLILLLHDIADVVGYGIKCSVDTRYTKVTLSIYATLLIVWAYTRLYVLPFVVLPASIIARDAFTNSPDYRRWDWNMQIYQIHILIVLHYYWYVLFIWMGYQYFKTGITQDLQQQVGGEEDVCSSSQKKND